LKKNIEEVVEGMNSIMAQFEEEGRWRHCAVGLLMRFTGSDTPMLACISFVTPHFLSSYSKNAMHDHELTKSPSADQQH
jgi:hypothetical protein